VNVRRARQNSSPLFPHYFYKLSAVLEGKCVLMEKKKCLTHLKNVKNSKNKITWDWKWVSAALNVNKATLMQQEKCIQLCIFFQCLLGWFVHLY